MVKLDPQFDETKRLPVVGGRLQFALIPKEEKHQIIIPHNDPVTEKIYHARICESKSFAAPDYSHSSTSTIGLHKEDEK